MSARSVTSWLVVGAATSGACTGILGLPDVPPASIDGGADETAPSIDGGADQTAASIDAGAEGGGSGGGGGSAPSSSGGSSGGGVDSGSGDAGTDACPAAAACTPGETRCASATSVETCADVAGCGTTWTAPIACPEDAGATGFYVCERFGGASCVDPNWAEWPMPNGSADVDAGAPYLEAYTTVSPAPGRTVTDNITGLMWQDPPSSEAYSWASADGGMTAQSYCANLNTIAYAGHVDWRLPSGIELMSLVDLSVGDPAINSFYFTLGTTGSFWASTPAVGAPAQAWFVNFGGVGAGNMASSVTSAARSVRCVR